MRTPEEKRAIDTERSRRFRARAREREARLRVEDPARWKEAVEARRRADRERRLRRLARDPGAREREREGARRRYARRRTDPEFLRYRSEVSRRSKRKRAAERRGEGT